MVQKQQIKHFFQLIFFGLFVYFSSKSLVSFYNGDVIYDTTHDKDNDKVSFPSMTLCPVMQVVFFNSDTDDVYYSQLNA